MVHKKGYFLWFVSTFSYILSTKNKREKEQTAEEKPKIKTYYWYYGCYKTLENTLLHKKRNNKIKSSLDIKYNMRLSEHHKLDEDHQIF